MPVEVGEGDGVLGRLLVVGDAGVLEPVPPQDLVRQVGRPHLKKVKQFSFFNMKDKNIETVFYREEEIATKCTGYLCKGPSFKTKQL